MENKNTKIWIFVFTAVLMAAGSVSSFIAQKNSFYKGTEPASEVELNAAQNGYASVISAGDAASDLGYIVVEDDSTDKKVKESLSSLLAETAQAVKSVSAVMRKKIETEEKLEREARLITPSPCAGKGAPIIKDSVVIGCSDDDKEAEKAKEVLTREVAKVIAKEPRSAGRPKQSTPGPAPKIKVTAAVTDYSASCESQGKLTYAGEDRPGLLYGMCIEK